MDPATLSLLSSAIGFSKAGYQAGSMVVGQRQQAQLAQIKEQHLREQKEIEAQIENTRRKRIYMVLGIAAVPMVIALVIRQRKMETDQ